jgi:hydrogenase nickel incorporation protein HypA/HybF
MHEVSIVANIFEILEEKAREQKAAKVVSVQLKVGALSGVVSENLRSAFEMYKTGTLAETAELKIEDVHFKVRCKSCGKETIKDDYVLLCPHCGGRDLEAVEGTELTLERIELEI